MLIGMIFTTGYEAGAWEIATAIGSVVTGIGAIGAAGVSIWIANRGERRNREQADARIAVQAFALRRNLRSWLMEEVPDDPVQVWDKVNELVSSSGYDLAEERALSMSLEAGRGSDEAQSNALEALQHFYRATGRLNDVQARSRNEVRSGHHDDFVRQQVRQALHEIEDCVDVLGSIVDRAMEPAPIKIRM